MTNILLAIGLACFVGSSIIIGFSLIAYYIKKIHNNIKRDSIIKNSNNVIDFCAYKQAKKRKLA
jgi:hypothetical protein